MQHNLSVCYPSKHFKNCGVLALQNSGKRIMSEQMRKKLEDNVSEAYRKNWGNKVEEELEKVMANIDACLERESLVSGKNTLGLHICSSTYICTR